VRGKLVFGSYEVKLKVLEVTTAFETRSRFALIRHERIETRPEKRLETRF
jgi:hypothetical protein